MTLQEKLEQLRKKRDWHPDTKELLDFWERSITEIELDNEFFEQARVKELAQRIEKLVLISNELLLDRNLTETQRQYHFALKDVADIMNQTFSQKFNKSYLSSIETEIDDELKNI